MIDKEVLKKKITKMGLDKYEDEIYLEYEKGIQELVEKLLKKYKKMDNLEKLEKSKPSIPLKKVFTDYSNYNLPSWILKDIENVSVIGKSKKVLRTSDGRKYHIDNKLNHLSGREWTYFLCSVFNTKYSTKGEEGCAYNIRKIHPSPKPPILMKEIIKFFTKENETVFDFFAGVGGTLLGASMCGRKAIGIELNFKYIEAYNQASLEMGYQPQKMICGNSIQLLESSSLLDKLFEEQKASLILLDPPYANMMTRPKTGEFMRWKGSTQSTPFTSSEYDLGNMSISQFHEVFTQMIKNSIKYLKNNGHIVIFIKDLQPEGKKLNLLHAEIINNINSIDCLFYQGLKIWADQTVNLFPYGYPYSFVANQIHQYILVFKKKES